MVGRAPSLDKLEQCLGYCFRSKKLLRAALTHSSSQKVSSQKANREKNNSRHNDNERLEFLGDRVLGLSIASQLMKAFPVAREGELARRYSRLVSRKFCAEIARSIDLGDYLVLSTGEARSGGRTKSNILADAMEAVLGAIFEDGGYEAAHEVIVQLWHEHLDHGDCVELDAKTALQEWALGRSTHLPTYRLVSRSGPDHEPVFVCEVVVEGVGTGQGSGASKRLAEQMAAKDLLEQKQIWDKTPS